MRAIPSIGRRSAWAAALAVLVAGATVAACGRDAAGDRVDGVGRPVVVVTTSVLGDVVSEVLGDLADTEVLMPAGASPHEYQPSARDVTAVRSADAIIANGAGLEEGLEGVVARAARDGIPTFEAASAAGLAEEQEGVAGTGDAADGPAQGTGEADGDEHDHADGDEHTDGAGAHFFTSPAAMVTVVEALVEFFEREVPSLDGGMLRRRGAAYADELRAVDAEVEEVLAGIPAERRVLVTNHDVFSAFAVRYGFEVRGTLLPGSSTAGQANAATLASLAATIRAAGVPAIFVDISSSDRVARSLAAEAGGVEVVALYTESLGGADSDAPTYVDMIRTNARRIANALRP